MNMMKWPKRRMPKTPHHHILNMVQELQSYIRAQADKYRAAREHRYLSELREIQSQLCEIAEAINEHRLF